MPPAAHNDAKIAFTREIDGRRHMFDFCRRDDVGTRFGFPRANPLAGLCQDGTIADEIRILEFTEERKALGVVGRFATELEW
ncbi:hypothetical protein [Paraburkholderia sp. JPY419]|uniref:hypothetical protein n=1 Tax=Paraburkholderia sp. JPY419 TaxID=667660 RepID=UPI003D23989B